MAATQNKSELQKMRDMVGQPTCNPIQTRQATLLQGAAAQHLLAATAGVPIFGMCDMFAMDQIAGDPSAASDLASLLGGEGTGAGSASPDDVNAASPDGAVADADTGADGENLDNGGDSGIGGTANPGSAISGDVGGGGGGDGGGASGGSGGSASHFSEGGGSSAPLPSGTLAGLLCLGGAAVAYRIRMSKTSTR
jgi:hypothetical protein